MIHVLLSILYFHSVDEFNLFYLILSDSPRNTKHKVIWYEPMDSDVSHDLNPPNSWNLNVDDLADFNNINSCPNVGTVGNPCWAFCEGSMTRINSTIGYRNVSLTYSIHPWASASCRISWGNGIIFANVDRTYDANDEIIHKTVYLPIESWNQEELTISIATAPGANPCCFISEFTLAGEEITPTTPSPTMQPSTMTPSGTCIHECYILMKLISEMYLFDIFRSFHSNNNVSEHNESNRYKHI